MIDPGMYAAAADTVLKLIQGPAGPAAPQLPNAQGPGMKASGVMGQILGQLQPSPTGQNDLLPGTLAAASTPTPKSPKDTPHNNTLKDVAGELVPIAAPKSKDLKKVKVNGEKGGGMFGDMSQEEMAMLGLSVASSLFAPPPAPPAPGLPGVPSAGMKPTF